MDKAHDATMERFRRQPWTIELDVEAHAEWSSRKLARTLNAAEMEDLRGMLAVRGVVPAPEYDDEPQPGPRGLRGGGGKKHNLGMRTPEPKRRRATAQAPGDAEHDEAPADEVAAGEPADSVGRVGRSLREELADDSGRAKEPASREAAPASRWTWRWEPPQHKVAPMPQDITVRANRRSWYNNPDSGAINASRTQTGATCGLHAVNHILAVSDKPALEQSFFEKTALDANLGDAPSNLCQPGGSNYDIAVLNFNLVRLGLSVFPMTPADIEGSEGRMSILAGSRLSAPFADHVIREGAYEAHGYLLRHPNYRGHWLSLLPSHLMDASTKPDTVALLCDSLYSAPFELTQEQTEQLLQASALDAATSLSDFNSDFGCFLVGKRTDQ